MNQPTIYGVIVPGAVREPGNAPIPAEGIIVFTDGCYSSYGIVAVARALAPLDLQALRQEWYAQNPTLPENPSPFVAWLEAKGMVTEIPYIEANSDSSGFTPRIDFEVMAHEVIRSSD